MKIPSMIHLRPEQVELAITKATELQAAILAFTSTLPADAGDDAKRARMMQAIGGVMVTFRLMQLPQRLAAKIPKV